MTRHILAGITLLGLAGCAHERVAQRSPQGALGPVGLPPEVPPIAQSINGGLPPPDPATIRATAGVAVNRGPARGRAVASRAPADAAAPVAQVPIVPPAGSATNQRGPTASTPLVAHDEPASAAGPALGASIPLIGAAAGEPPPSPPVVASETPQAPVESEPPAVPPLTPGAAEPRSLPADPVASSPPAPASSLGEPAGAAAVASPNPNPAPVPVAETAAVAPVPAAASPVSVPEPVTAAPATADAGVAPAQGGGPASIPLEVIPGSQAAAPATAASTSPSVTEADRVPVPASTPTGPAPGGNVPDAVSRITAPPAQPASTPRDPLLGADPDVMPNLDVAPPAADARVAPAAGLAPAPASMPPASASPAGANGPADVMPPIAPAAGMPAALEGPPQPAPLPETGPASALAPLPASSSVPPASAPDPLAPVDALAPVPASAPVPPASAPDPLLGANPPLMPDQAAPPAGAPGVPPPASPSGGAPAPAASADVTSPIVLPPPSAVPTDPQTPATPPVMAPPISAPTPASNPPAPSAAREDPKLDAKLVRTAADPRTVRSNMTLKPDSPAAKVSQASTIAARVGDEIITRTELFAAVKERGKKQFAGQKVKLKPEEIAVLASVTLADLVDRSLVLQEAKRKLKDPKKYQMVIGAADQQFNQHELPGLMRKYHVTDERALKEALIADDSSLEQVRENFRGQFIAGGYLGQQLNSKLRVDLPEKLAYYNVHLSEYERPAQITWREILVEVKKSPSRAEARRRAEAILARLRRGEDFATVARSNSDGPTRKLGGRWQTRPGGYAVSSVNNVLETSPVGQISPIVEGPSSFHIVLVEERREPGPARFDEVQDDVDRAVYNAKQRKLTDEFLDDLRSHTYVWTMFDGTMNDPKVLRAKHSR